MCAACMHVRAAFTSACIEGVYFDVVGDVRGLPAKQRVRRHVGRKLVTRVCILVQSLGERVQR